MQENESGCFFLNTVYRIPLQGVATRQKRQINEQTNEQTDSIMAYSPRFAVGA